MGFLSSSPFRFQEKGNLEVLLFSIQSKLRACNRRLFVPREGCGIWDIDKVRLRMSGRSRVTPCGCVGCALLKGTIYSCRHHGLAIHPDSFPARMCHEGAIFFFPVYTKVL